MKNLKKKLNKFKQPFKIFLAIAGVIVGIGVLGYGVGLDLVYSQRLHCAFFERGIERMRKLLMPMGFRYHVASEIIVGSMGISFTTLSLLMTMGINLSNRFEIKIFGIPRWELETSVAHKIYNKFRILIYIFPFLMLISINLKLCVTGYTILIYNMIFLVIEYRFIIRSYRWEKEIDYTVNKLIAVFEEKDDKLVRDYLEYQVWLEEVRIGIEKSGGWESAERLCEYFLQKTSAFEREKCYICSYLFFDIIFGKSCQDGDNNSALRCIKRYVYGLYDKKTSTWNEAVFCALLKAVFKYWDEAQVQGFLKWFMCFVNRSQGGDASRQNDIYNLQKSQINMVMVLLEEWKTRHKVYKGFLDQLLVTMWFKRGRSNFDSNLELFEVVHKVEERIRYVSDSTLSGYEDLRKDNEVNRGISFIGSTIRKRNEG